MADEVYHLLLNLSPSDKARVLSYLCGYFDDNEEFVEVIERWLGRNKS